MRHHRIVFCEVIRAMLFVNVCDPVHLIKGIHGDQLSHRAAVLEHLLAEFRLCAFSWFSVARKCLLFREEIWICLNNVLFACRQSLRLEVVGEAYSYLATFHTTTFIFRAESMPRLATTRQNP